MELRIWGLAHAHALAIVCENLKFLDIFVGLARHDGVNAAGVVANHSSEGASAVRSGIRPEGQVMLFGLVPQMIEDDSGLHSRNAAFGVEFKNLCHVLGEVKHHGNVAALARQRSPSTTAKHGGAVLAANRHSSNYIFDVARNHDRNRDLAVIRSVRGIKRTATIIESNLTAKVASQS